MKQIDKLFIIIEQVFDIPPDELISRSRRHPLPDARKVAAIMLFLSNMTLKQIGIVLGNRDHSTILHSIQSHNNIVELAENCCYKNDYAKEYARKFDEVQRRYTDLGKKKIYISGKVSGLPYEEVKAKFAYAQRILEGVGYKVYNPMEFVAPNTEYDEAMRICFRYVTYSDEIYMLKGHTDSQGATKELLLAQWVGMGVKFQPEALKCEISGEAG